MPRPSPSSSLQISIDQVINAAHRSAVLDVIAQTPPSTQLGDIWEALAGGGHAEQFASMTLAEIAGAVAGGPAPKTVASGAARRATRQAKKPAAPRAGKRNTHTKDGRDAIDADVLTFLQGKGETRAKDIRAKVGGTEAQVRDCLKRLSQARKVKISGQKRGTTYSLAAGKPAATSTPKAKKKATRRKSKSAAPKAAPVKAAAAAPGKPPVAKKKRAPSKRTAKKKAATKKPVTTAPAEAVS